MTSIDPSYKQFVDSRVKWMPSHAENLVHATIGIMGEMAEFNAAKSRENALEELGDLDFYLVHYALAWERAGEDISVEAAPISSPITLQSAIFLAQNAAGDLLDAAKKAWVYNKLLEVVYLDSKFPFFILQNRLQIIHNFYNISRGTLQANTEAKLRIRYPDGYSDAAAQVRADKIQGK